ncbi:MAG TPA: tetratricopeptide repeat protein [Planctomycetota bacterium]|nr:tetratricopeptide repeat protein [Planctomycetota bacterium]
MADTWTQRYLAGLKLFGQQRHTDAIAEYRAALALAPDNTDVLHALAMAQMHAGLLDEAIATGNRIVELDPADAMAHTSLSMFWQRKGDIEEAERQAAHARMKAWKAELKKNPDAPPPDEGGLGVLQ